ncbi:hypothetical protein V8E54_002031 [Elaphomyces granulatus]
MVPWTLYWYVHKATRKLSSDQTNRNFRFIVSTGFLSNSEDQIESILRRRTFLDEFPNGKSVPGYCWMRLTVMISLRLRNIGENALEYGPDMLLNQYILDVNYELESSWILIPQDQDIIHASRRPVEASCGIQGLD